MNYLGPLLDMRLVLRRILVTEDSYECAEDPILTIGNRIDWFFRLDVPDMVYSEEICIEECQDQYIHVGLAASRPVPGNRLIQANS